MIVSMRKVFVVGSEANSAALIEAVRRAGVVHVVPVQLAARVDAGVEREVDRLEKAVAVLEALPKHSSGSPAVSPALHSADLSPLAEESLALDKKRSELASQKSGLLRRIDELSPWGELRLEDVRALQDAGLHVVFATLPRQELHRVKGDGVQPLGELAGRQLVGVVGRQVPQLPASASVLELPPIDRPTLRAELAQVEGELIAVTLRLSSLRGAVRSMRDLLATARAQLEVASVEAAGLRDEHFFGLQGWVPTTEEPKLVEAIRGLGAATARDAEPDELPPTLLRPPNWAKPALGLLGMLGLTPGYREADVSVAFMVAVPLFAAMLISDAGYGALLLIVPLLAYRRAVAALGRPLTHFLAVVGAVAVVWGLLTGSVFGVDLARLLTGRPPLVEVSQEEPAMRLLMRGAFTIGVVHLSLGQGWRAVLTWPHPTFLARVGWALFLWGMYGVVTMFVLGSTFGWATPWPWLLSAGAALVVLFTAPQRNLLKAILLGLANFPLSALGTFSDIMSYVRLMAVGLAGSVLAVSFNSLASSAGPAMMVPILFFGHGLNLGLCVIALFAHGVRLNVLEFSNNFGMEWGGYPYLPLELQPQHTEGS